MHRSLLCAAALAAASLAQAQAPGQGAQNAFNPAISAVLNGAYANLARDPQTYRIDGFVPTQGEVAPPRRGFSLGESELALSANIDPLFRGSFVAALTPDEGDAEVEEAFIETLALPRGFTARAGRFFSSVGYQNLQHAHAWDFADPPLVMKAFLGGQLADDGVQLRWLAPTELYWDLGAELGRGRGFPASVPEGGKNGAGTLTLFTRLGGDIGASTAWQAGVSHLRTDPHERAFDDPVAGATDSFSGTSRLWALSGVLKWAPDGNATRTSLKLQGEYFRRSEEGALIFDRPGTATQSGYASRASGWYAQAVYQFMPRWRAGYRYDELRSGEASVDASLFPILDPYRPKKHSAMIDWSPSEFSRLRVQLARDYARRDEPDTQLLVQYIVSLGAHGAHTF